MSVGGRRESERGDMTRLRGVHPLVVSAVRAFSTDAVRRASAGATAGHRDDAERRS
jgi:hypothetical protein